MMKRVRVNGWKNHSYEIGETIAGAYRDFDGNIGELEEFWKGFGDWRTVMRDVKIQKKEESWPFGLVLRDYFRDRMTRRYEHKSVMVLFPPKDSEYPAQVLSKGKVDEDFVLDACRDALECVRTYKDYQASLESDS